MHKHLAFGASLAVIAAPAFATKARLVALGEDVIGSQYLSDSRNVFLNAAAINDYKNLVVFEWGGDGSTAPVAKLDTDSRAQAEGGVFYGHGNLVYGVYLGGESSQSHDARRFLALDDRRVHQDNQLDFFLGGDTGLKWGANLTYSQNKSDTEDIDSKTLSSRLGVNGGMWEAFANLSLVNKFEGNIGGGTNDEEFEGNLGYEIGGTFNTGKGKVFGYWRHSGWEQESDEAIAGTAGPAYVGEAEVAIDRYIVGWGREDKVSDRATLIYKASLQMNRRKLETDTDGDAQLNDQFVPVVVGLEYDSASWLTLRGSITHNIWGKADNEIDDTVTAAGLNTIVTNTYSEGKRTIANSTNVNAGATLKFGDFNVDGLIGTGSGTSASESGVLTTDNLMSRVAMTYKF